MGKARIKKQSIWIDMTPMSDVMVLLLTFFMLTATFTKNEAVKVNTPGSVSDTKIPENNTLTILIDPEGKVFIGMDKPGTQEAMLSEMFSKYDIGLKGEEFQKLKSITNIGVGMAEMKHFAGLPSGEMNKFQESKGLPLDSVDGGMSEFQEWVKAARDANGSDMKMSIKADAATPYQNVKKVMSELQDMNENRYYLITAYKNKED